MAKNGWNNYNFQKWMQKSDSAPKKLYIPAGTKFSALFLKILKISAIFSKNGPKMAEIFTIFKNGCKNRTQRPKNYIYLLVPSSVCYFSWFSKFQPFFAKVLLKKAKPDKFYDWNTMLFYFLLYSVSKNVKLVHYHSFLYLITL